MGSCFGQQCFHLGINSKIFHFFFIVTFHIFLEVLMPSPWICVTGFDIIKCLPQHSESFFWVLELVILRSWRVQWCHPCNQWPSTLLIRHHILVFVRQPKRRCQPKWLE